MDDMDNQRSNKTLIFSIAGMVIAIGFITFFSFESFKGFASQSAIVGPQLALGDDPVPASATTTQTDSPHIVELPTLPVVATTTMTAGAVVTASTPTPKPTSASRTANEIATTTTPPAPISLPYSLATFDLKDWLFDWGVAASEGGALYLGAPTSTTGGAVFLAGSNLWTNYDFQASVDWIKGQTVSLVAREQDQNNFVYCDFSNNWVDVIQRIDNADQVLNQTQSPAGGAGTTYELGIVVYGNDVACTVNDQVIASGVLTTNALSAGGIGFTSWDPTPGNSALMIQNLQVTPLTANVIPVPFPVPTAPTPAALPTPPTPITSTSTTTTNTAPVPPPPPSQPTTPTPLVLGLPYNENNFLDDSNWLATWGMIANDATTPGAIDIESASTTTGSFAMLQGSTSWKNYKFDTTLDWAKGQTFGLVARYIDNNDYVVCEFNEPDNGDVQIQLEQYANGIENILSQGSFTNYFPASGTFVDAFIQVNNTQGLCSLDGHQITNSTPSSYLINTPFTGGIGFTNWDPANDNTQLIVSNVSVTPL